MGLMFTASGIRGIYNRDFSSNLAYKLIRAFVNEFKVRSVMVGRDTRPSGPPLEHAAISSLIDSGCKVYTAGVQPTPVILWACRAMKLDAAIIITASHNPPEWNAIKLAHEGLLLDDQAVNRLREAFYHDSGGGMSSKPGEVLAIDPLIDYINAALRHLDRETISRYGLKVVIDPGGGAGYKATPVLLRMLGCKVITVNSAPGIFTRKVEPTPDALKGLSEAVKAYDADVGFAHDADADRLVCVADGGEVMAEDYGLAIASLHVLSRLKGPLVVSIASSMIFNWIAEKMGVNIYWSPVGEARVVRVIMKHGAPIGGEGSSGGVIPAFFNLARDGVFGAALIVEALATRGESMSRLISKLPRYYQARGAIACDPSKYEKVMSGLVNEFAGMDLDLTDGIKIWLKDSWVLVRPSQTEPKIRVLCEAISEDRAHALLIEYMNVVKGIVERLT
ncbi:MAG: phosphoglucosamine mutase [Candidatus Nezhaarchaeota archaeon]|nr:phosphoglucosamine mutase [Candidatus Nezhaarchaeota archaeon]MCX8141533.1 phosphoglucosamine mutase [Candidatus Nezhaarchaeota archaeon]MDW8049800.1 phosphoglucosamine mutase [Nitrososphaerota archaeon]